MRYVLSAARSSRGDWHIAPPGAATFLVAACCIVALLAAPASASVRDAYGDAIPGRLIVGFLDDGSARFDRDAAEARAARIQDMLGLPVDHLRFLASGAQLLSLPEHVDPREAAWQVRERMDVEYAEPDRYVETFLVPDDPRFNEQWHLRAPITDAGAASLPDAWDETTGLGAVVAVVDSGLPAGRHAELRGRIVPGYDLIADPLFSLDGDARDPFPEDVARRRWHGLRVAGVVAATANNGTGVAGTAFDSEILPLRVTGFEGRLGCMSDLADAIKWAVGNRVPGLPLNRHPAQVINLSVGMDGVDTTCPIEIQMAVDEARAAGATVIAAVGNTDEDASSIWPANCDGVIAVAALARDGSKADESNFGTLVSVSAPGGEVEPNGNGFDPDGVLTLFNTGTDEPGADAFTFTEGTSFAAPHVSGVAALIKSLRPNLAVRDVKRIIETTARPFPAEVDNACDTSRCGTGMLDAAAAIRALPAPSGPQIQGLNPESGGRRDSVTIDGTGFGTRRGTVRFAHREARIRRWSDSRITLRVPGGLGGRVPVTVVRRDGLRSAAADFSFDEPLTLRRLRVRGRGVVRAGGSARYRARATYGDGFSENVTDFVTWRVLGPSGSDASFGKVPHNVLRVGSVSTPARVRVQAILRYLGDGGTGATAEKTVVLRPAARGRIELLSVRGPRDLTERTMGVYRAIAHFDDGSMEDVTGQTVWSHGPHTNIQRNGVLSASSVDGDQESFVRAEYDHAGTRRMAFIPLVVRDKVLESVEVRGPGEVGEGFTAQYTAIAKFSDGSDLDVTSERARWSASGPFAVIDRSGELTARQVSEDRTTTLRARVNYAGVSKSGTHDVRIKNRVLESVTVAGPPEVVEEGTAKYTATARYSDGTSEDVTGHMKTEWEISSPAATIDRGMLQASTVDGDQDIVVTARFTDGITVDDDKMVTIADLPVESPRIEGPTTVIGGLGVQYRAFIPGVDGPDDVTDQAEWRVTPPHSIEDGLLRVALVDADQPITVSATFARGEDSGSASLEVSVLDQSVAGLTVNGPSEVNENTTAQYEAVAVFADGREVPVTDRVVWRARGGGTSIDGQGLLKARNVGGDRSTTVTARFIHDGNRVVGTRAVTIRNRAPVSVRVEGPESVDERTTTPYQAFAVYADGSEIDVTGTARWRATTGRARALNRRGSEGQVKARRVRQDKPIEVRARLGSGRQAVTGVLPVTILNTD